MHDFKGHMNKAVQWNPAIADTLGTIRSVPNKEVSLIQGLINTNMAYLRPNTVSFICSVSLFQSVHIEGFHCIQYSPNRVLCKHKLMNFADVQVSDFALLTTSVKILLLIYSEVHVIPYKK